jgi:hypothetical protein
MLGGIKDTPVTFTKIKQQTLKKMAWHENSVFTNGGGSVKFSVELHSHASYDNNIMRP